LRDGNKISNLTIDVNYIIRIGTYDCDELNVFDCEGFRVYFYHFDIVEGRDIQSKLVKISEEEIVNYYNVWFYKFK